MYVYQALVSQQEDGSWFGEFPDFEGCYSDGWDLNQLAENLAETLQLHIALLLDEGRELPVSQILPKTETLVIAVDVSQDFVERTKCLTVTEAARELGVSKGRVSQLLSAGKLQAVQFGRERLVTIASVNQRLKEKPQAGRPVAESVEYVQIKLD